MGDKGVKRIERNKEGVPCWDGDASTFQEYAEVAALWEQSIPYHKRYLAGPKLINELTGTARRFVMAKDPTWVSYEGGVQVLLDYLRQNLGLPQMSELSDFMAKYFRFSKRRRNESMNDYITRKAELYARTKYSLSRVQQRYEPKKTPSSRSDPGPSDLRRSLTNGSGPPSEAPEAPEPHDLPRPGWNAGPPHVEDWLRDTEEPEDPWSGYRRDQWSWHDWQPSSQWHERQWYPNKNNYQSSGQLWDHDGPELLPDFVQGWFLLQDAGLETAERNLVLAALKNDFSVLRVAQELRNQWGDEDLRRRDMSQRGAAWVVSEQPSDGEAVGDWDSPDYAQLVESGLNAEGLAVMESAEDTAQEAMVTIEKNKRTLREAREKQKFVKMSRQYYRSGDRNFRRPPNREGQLPDGAGIKCLRCGGPHRVAHCPQKHKDQATLAQHDELAPFVCYADTAGGEQACMASANITTAQAVEQGKAVLDGGATKTLASVAALERIMELNNGKNGCHGVRNLDLADRPMFGFGNSTTDRCLSTACLDITAGGRKGELRVHTLDRGEGPLLFSVEALRSLGAVIDFQADLAVFRNLDPTQVVQLERSSTGHQLLPLTEDLFAKATKTAEPVPGLSAYL